jgi:hypothetical protein
MKKFIFLLVVWFGLFSFTNVKSSNLVVKTDKTVRDGGIRCNHRTVHIRFLNTFNNSKKFNAGSFYSSGYYSDVSDFSDVNEKYSHIVFKISDSRFEKCIEEFRSKILNLNFEVGIFLYIATNNRLYVDRVIEILSQSKQKIYILNIHLMKENKLNLENLHSIENLVVSGSIKECSMSKFSYPKSIYLANADSLNKFDFNVDSISHFRMNGRLNNESWLTNLVKNAQNLNFLVLYGSRLKSMPNLGDFQNMKWLEYVDQDFDEIDINKLPNHVDVLHMKFIKSNEIVFSNNKKSIGIFNIEDSIVPNLFETLIQLVEK